MRSDSNSMTISIAATATVCQYPVMSWAVNAFSWPPWRAIMLRKSSPGVVVVPWNIMCSKKWAKPPLPAGSSAAPAL